MNTNNASPLSERDLEKLYEEMLDEGYGSVAIAGHYYLTSIALRVVDPVAYRCGMADWLDSVLGELLVEINGEYFYKSEVDDDTAD